MSNGRYVILRYPDMRYTDVWADEESEAILLVLNGLADGSAVALYDPAEFDPETEIGVKEHYAPESFPVKAETLQSYRDVEPGHE